jgi:hypothetical protein
MSLHSACRASFQKKSPQPAGLTLRGPGFFFFSVCHGAGFLETLPLTPWTPSPPCHRLVRVCSNWGDMAAYSLHNIYMAIRGVV